jgi:ribosome maturation protein Sdo1
MLFQGKDIKKVRKSIAKFINSINLIPFERKELIVPEFKETLQDAITELKDLGTVTNCIKHGGNQYIKITLLSPREYDMVIKSY